jgi:hypothetical protein
MTDKTYFLKLNAESEQEALVFLHVLGRPTLVVDRAADAIKELEAARCNINECPICKGNADTDSEFEHVDNHIDAAIGLLK